MFAHRINRPVASAMPTGGQPQAGRLATLMPVALTDLPAVVAPPLPRRTPLTALLAANAVSIVGNFMTLVAVPWFVLELTGSPARTGLAAIAVMLPQVLAGFFASSLVDRLGFVRASILADLTAGGTVALVPLLSATTGMAFWQLLLLLFCGNLLNTPGTTARQSMLPDLIALADVPAERANAWYQTIFNFTSLAGPLLAGIAIPIIGTSNVLWLDAASFALSALAIARFVPAPRTPARQSAAPYLMQLREGVRFIYRERLLLALTATATATGFLGPAFFNAILPIYAQREYGDARALGLLRGGWGAGLLLGSLLYAAVADRVPRRLAYALAYTVGVLPFSLILWVPPLAVSVAAMVVAAIAFGPLQALRLTIQQERTPDALRSRVFGTSNAVMFLAAPLGTVLFTSMVPGWGVIATIAAMVAVWVAIAVTIWLTPTFRGMDRPAAGAR
jgi:MFS family permease